VSGAWAEGIWDQGRAHSAARKYLQEGSGRRRCRVSIFFVLFLLYVLLLIFSSAPSTPTLSQERGPDRGVDTEQAERDAREITNAFQDALLNNNDNAMDIDSDTNNCEGEDERGDDDEEAVLVDPQAQSAKEWVCVRTLGM
jgi:hypothetical protein